MTKNESAQPQLPPLGDCPRCKGFGQVDKSTSVPRKCYLCQGTGKLPRNSEDLELQLLSALAENESLKARLQQRDKQIAVFNSGGFADADALAEKFLDLQSELHAFRSQAYEELEMVTVVVGGRKHANSAPFPSAIVVFRPKTITI